MRVEGTRNEGRELGVRGMELGVGRWQLGVKTGRKWSYQLKDEVEWVKSFPAYIFACP